ncbi:sugar phosphate isomerase/epimerase family protein [Paenibacillus flagellatus]|uniref:Sugar phosphate isomerase/epimerase n=1 Tax=Paenibacillus flagellatus TaxID=2211139 RepID=A0A2V5KXI8_9BACL|nr:sugar phosphate isomerase/epimerase [Paenibacillus flagellatus]PYI57157.1 sugar phosphate isomerase/epimerase [Paenibacillus flagellatus]
MKIAAQLYTLRDFLKTEDDIATTLQRVKEIGYNAVQVSGVGPIDDRKLKELADRAGLHICATHIPYSDMVNDLDAVIAKHKLWECRYVGIGGLPVEYRKDAASYAAFAKEASAIAGRLKEAGLSFVYHNHAFEFRKFEGGKSGMEILFDESDASSFGFELDVHWVQAGGGDPIEWIRKVDGRMKVIHLKDYTVTGDSERQFAEVGEGNMNFRGILDACKETGVEWGAVEQDTCYGRDPFECLAVSARNLKALGAEF